jgi:hypothetical protein
MSRRAIAVLAAIIFLAAVVAGISLRDRARSLQGEAVDGHVLFPALAAHTADIARIEIVSGEGTITIEKRGDEWVLPAKGGYPASLARIRDLVSTMAGMTLLERKTADPARYPDLALGDPGQEEGAGKLVRLEDGSGAVLAAAVFGRVSPSLGRMGGGMYVRRQDDPQAWLAQGLFQIPTTVLSWADPIVLDAGNPKAIRSMTLADGGGKTIETFTRAKPDDAFAAQPPVPGKPDVSKMDHLADIVAVLNFEDVRPLPTDAGKPSRVVTFQGFDDARYRISLYGHRKDGWVTFEQQAPNTNAYQKVHAGFEYQLPDYRLALLQSTAKEFVDSAGAAHPVKDRP